MASGLKYITRLILEIVPSEVDPNLKTRSEEERGRRFLEDCHREFRQGDKRALFRAANLCGSLDLIMPEWVAIAFREGWIKIANFEVKTLDEAFGPLYPKGTHLHRVREAEDKKGPVFERVLRRHLLSDEPIGEALFEAVGKELHLSASRTRKLYYRGLADMKAWGRSDFSPR